MHIKINPGHSLFKLNLETGEIIRIPNDSIIEKGILYCSSLNIKNAKKRFEKMIDHVILNHKP